MSLPTFLTSLENLVVEIALWIVLVPKTLWRVFKEPRALTAMTTEAQVAAESAGEYVSPVLLWLLSGVLPAVPSIATGFGGPEWIAHPLMAGLGVEPKIASVATLLLMGPLAFASAQTLIARKVFSRQSLRTPFAVQCGCFAPFLFLYSIALQAKILAVVTRYDWILEPLSVVLFAISVLWFLRAEVLILRVGLPGRWRPILAVAVGFLMWSILMLVSRLVLNVLGVFYG